MMAVYDSSIDRCAMSVYNIGQIGTTPVREMPTPM
jgi:hypothetical protein